MVEERNKYVILYDYYMELIPKAKRTIFEDYYFNNLSLSEIAENNSISRNAVHKTIKNVENALEEFEQKLKMFEKDQQLKKIIEEIVDEKLKEKLKNIYEG